MSQGSLGWMNAKSRCCVACAASVQVEGLVGGLGLGARSGAMLHETMVPATQGFSQSRVHQIKTLQNLKSTHTFLSLL